MRFYALSEEYKVVVAGKTALKERNKNINIYLTSPEEEQFRQLFDVYSFQAVFYISGYADGGEGLFGEIQQLEKVMLECRRSRVEKLIVLSTIESQNFVIQYGKQGEVLKKDYASSRTFGSFSDGGDVPLLCGKKPSSAVFFSDCPIWRTGLTIRIFWGRFSTGCTGKIK